MDRNRRIIEEVARQNGALALEWKYGRKHHRVTMRLTGGVTAIMHYSHASTEVFKLQGWTRQAITRALHRANP